MKLSFSITLTLTVLCTAACTTQVAYVSGQEFQRNECNRMPDAQERQRCLANANMTYDNYKREADAARDAK